IVGGSVAAAVVIVLGAWAFGGPGASLPSPDSTVAIVTDPTGEPTVDEQPDAAPVDPDTGEKGGGSEVVPVETTAENTVENPVENSVENTVAESEQTAPDVVSGGQG